MERNQWADRFTDTVVRRTDYDSVPGTDTVVLILLIPAIFGLLVTAVILIYHAEVFDDPDTTYIATAMGLLAQCGLAAFVLFSLANRTRRHVLRDTIWMDSLIGYVESHDADASGMRRVRDEIPHYYNISAFVSAGLWIVTTVIVVAGGIAMSRAGLSDFAYDTLVYAYLLVMVQFAVTLGSTIRFPYRHDDMQCRFTEELSDACSGFGLSVKPMEPSVRKPHSIANAILFVITLGLYAFILLLLANHRTNRHITSQWRYESHLMVSIIRFEGGIGVEGYGDNQPKNWLVRLIFNVL